MRANASEKRTKKELSKEQTKRKLMAAALDVFARKGFDAASTKLVATKAKVNEALIFRYFGDKAGLLLAVILDTIEATKNDIDNYPHGSSLEEEFFNCLSAHLERDIENENFLRVAISRGLIDPKMRQKITQQVPVKGSPILTKRLAELQSRGLIRKDADPQEIAFQTCVASVGVMFMGVAMSALSAKDAREAIRSLARMLCRAYAA